MKKIEANLCLSKLASREGQKTLLEMQQKINEVKHEDEKITQVPKFERKLMKSNKNSNLK